MYTHLYNICIGNGGFNLYKYNYPLSRTKLGADNIPIGKHLYVYYMCVCVILCSIW